MITLQELLQTKIVTSDARAETNEPIGFIPDFRVAVQKNIDGGTHFIIHPFGHSGETLDFVVEGNNITPLQDYEGKE